MTEVATQVVSKVADLYDGRWRVAGVPGLASSAWDPGRADLAAQDHNVLGSRTTSASHYWRRGLGDSAFTCSGQVFRCYTSAIRHICPPALFENRPSFRLTALKWNEGSGSGESAFGLAAYFDKLDVSEPLATRLPSRRWVGSLLGRSFASGVGPGSVRSGCPSRQPCICTLTIRRNATDGTGSFFLLRRGPTQVTQRSALQTASAGEFQPASVAAESIAADLDLWRTMVREYSEDARWART
jgi:hypothetical protein